MRYYIKIDKLKDKSAELRKYVNESVDECVIRLIGLKNEMEWDSPAGEKYLEIYSELVNKLYDIGTVIEKLASFMEYCADHYGEVNSKVIEDWKVLSEEINAARKKEFLDY